MNEISGPLRRPRQLLAEQEYLGSSSIHDGATAVALGFSGAPIEGPTHFSQLEPLAVRIWGREWYERGCISAHFLNMVVEGERARAVIEVPTDGARRVRARVQKEDGTAVLEATVSIGPDHGQTLLDQRRASLRFADDLVILGDMRVGMTGVRDEPVQIGFDRHLGTLYPFSLRDKLDVITERSGWFEDDGESPWGRAILPFEMVSVLAEYTMEEAQLPVRKPVVDLFADAEVRLIDGPLFVDEPYVARREVVALSESRRTESFWLLTRLYERTGQHLKAEVLINHANVKASYAGRT